MTNRKSWAVFILGLMVGGIIGWYAVVPLVKTMTPPAKADLHGVAPVEQTN